jgi:RimJ/RimL family protein N-acetyltransferase
VTSLLRDGTRVRLRPIQPSDAALLSAGLARLSPESARRRFLTPKPRFSSAELRYLTEVDQIDHVALVAVPAGDPRALAGVARWVRDPERPDAAEVAVVVCDDLQGQGLGTVLGLALADAARARGVTRFTATMLPENVPARRLFARISEHLDTAVRGGLYELTAALAA